MSITVRLEDNVNKKLQEYCKSNGIKKGWFVSRAVEENLRNLNEVSNGSN